MEGYAQLSLVQQSRCTTTLLTNTNLNSVEIRAPGWKRYQRRDRKRKGFKIILNKTDSSSRQHYLALLPMS